VGSALGIIVSNCGLSESSASSSFSTSSPASSSSPSSSVTPRAICFLWVKQQLNAKDNSLWEGVVIVEEEEEEMSQLRHVSRELYLVIDVSESQVSCRVTHSSPTHKLLLPPTTTTYV
jgi:hypothetical protein